MASKKQRVGRFLQMHANKRQESTRSMPVTSSRRWVSRRSPPATRSAPSTHPVVLETLDFPDPVISIAIEPKTTADMDKLGQSLERLALEDPSFKVATDSETGQTIISGMGELHLEIITDRLLREFNVEANVGRPQVAYKETITRADRRVEGRYIKQTGGSGDFGVVKLELVIPASAVRGFASRARSRGVRFPRSSSRRSSRLRGVGGEWDARRLPGGRREGPTPRWYA